MLKEYLNAAEIGGVLHGLKFFIFYVVCFLKKRLWQLYTIVLIQKPKQSHIAS